MRIRSLAEKIVLYFVTIGIIAIAVVSTYSFYTSKNALLERTFNQLTSVRVVKKKQIENLFNDRLSDLTLVLNAGSWEFLFDKNHSLEQEVAPHDYLLQYLRNSGYYQAIYFYAGNNFFIYTDLNHETKNLVSSKIKIDTNGVLYEIFSNQNMKPVIHDYITDGFSGEPRLFISGKTPANTDRQVQVAMEISIAAINQIMLEKNPSDGMGLSGESYLVGADGLMRSSSRFRQNSILKTAVQTEGVEKAFSGITGTSVIDDYRGIKVLSSYSLLKIPGLHWSILTEIDYAEATKSIYLIRNNILMLTILVAAILFIISMIFSKRITSPLIKLTGATTLIQQGKFEVTLPRVKKDEIGQLTNAFKSMIQSLKAKETELKNERNKRFTAMIDGQELERQRLSRELHDGLGQSLIALKLKLEAIDGKDICMTHKVIRETRSSFDETINEIRRISNNLMPAVLLEFGLVTAIKNICNDINENSGVNLVFRHSGQFTDLDQRLVIYIFRILQETLNNMVKHALAKNCEVYLERTEKMINASIYDDGRGFIPPDSINTGGSGIPNMKERIRLMNGTIDIESALGKGTHINIEIPIKKEHNVSDKSNVG